MRNIIAQIEGREYGPGGKFHVYGTCFCEDGNLLSQWRTYGGDVGYAIGFNALHLTAEKDETDPVFFKEVTYGISNP